MKDLPKEVLERISTKESVCRGFASVINSHSLEKSSDTPDFILAEYLWDCLQAYHTLAGSRVEYYKQDAQDNASMGTY